MGIYGQAKIDGVDAEVSMALATAGQAIEPGARLVRLILDDEARKKMGVGLDKMLSPLFTSILGEDIGGSMGIWPKLMILGGLLGLLGGGITGNKGMGGFGGIMMLAGLAPSLFKMISGGGDKGDKKIEETSALQPGQAIRNNPAAAPAPA